MVPWGDLLSPIKETRATSPFPLKPTLAFACHLGRIGVRLMFAHVQCSAPRGTRFFAVHRTIGGNRGDLATKTVPLGATYRVRAPDTSSNPIRAPPQELATKRVQEQKKRV